MAPAGLGGDRDPHRHEALQEPSASETWHRAPARRRQALSDRSNDCPRKIGILGAGSFGTALAVHLAGVGGHPVRLWARDPDLARSMAEERANPQYLPDVELPPGIVPTSDMADLADSEFLLVAAPSHGFREVLRQFLKFHADGR